MGRGPPRRVERGVGIIVTHLVEDQSFVSQTCLLAVIIQAT
jgi:hypothetical protein